MPSEGLRDLGVRPLAVAAVALTALSLRAGVTSAGAELSAIRQALDMGGATAGLLTALPAICFAGFGALAPAAARRVPARRLVVAGLVADVVGLAGRAAAETGLVFLGASLIALAGIAIANIMLPVVIKQDFPHRLGLMTGVFSMCVAIGIGLPAATTVPIGTATGHGWRSGLAFWAAPAMLGILPWVMLSRLRPAPGARLGERRLSQTVRKPSRLRLMRNPTALGLATFFGMQSLGAYAVMGWLPKIYSDAGLSAETSGLLLALTVVLAIPIGLVLPPYAARLRNQGAVVVAISLAGVAGYLSLLAAPATLPWLAAVLLTAAHCGYPLAITMIGLRAREPSASAQLSGFVQSLGYAMAAAGPFAIGVLRDVTGTWTAPLTVLMGCMVVQLLTGLVAARPRCVDDDAVSAPTPVVRTALT